MQFHSYRLLATAITEQSTRRNIDRQTLLNHLARQPSGSWMLSVEQAWHEEHKPYYRVWPGVLRPLLAVRLDRVECRHICLPCPAICVEMPVGHGAGADGRELSTVLAARRGDVIRAIVSWDAPERPYVQMTLDMRTGDRPIEDLIPEAAGKLDPSLADVPRPAILDGLRMLAMVCLIRDDPDLIVPRTNEDDRGRWQAADLARRLELIRRARKRGNWGWDIGRDIASLEDHPADDGDPGEPGARTVAPHFRRGGPALYWTGQGRQTPRIQIRRAAFVHGGELRKVPTGYYGDDVPPCPYCLRSMVRDGSHWRCARCAADT